MATLQAVLDEIVKCISSSGIGFANWYVGIASDPEVRLFIDHHVLRDSHWIYRNTGSEVNARELEQFLIENYRTQGNTGGGDKTTTYIYAYAITSTTKE